MSSDLGFPKSGALFPQLGTADLQRKLSSMYSQCSLRAVTTWQGQTQKTMHGDVANLLHNRS